MCLLGVSLTLLLILGVKCPENPNFGGVNMRFQAKLEKILKVSCYRNSCIDFDQILHNDGDHQVVVGVVPIGTQQIQDGGRPPFKKTVKSPYLCNRLTDFDEIWHSDVYWTLQQMYR